MKHPKLQHHEEEKLEQWHVLKDCKEVYGPDTFMRCAARLHYIQSGSVYHAINFDGYDIVRKIDGEIVFTFTYVDKRKNARAN